MKRKTTRNRGVFGPIGHNGNRGLFLSAYAPAEGALPPKWGIVLPLSAVVYWIESERHGPHARCLRGNLTGERSVTFFCASFLRQPAEARCRRVEAWAENGAGHHKGRRRSRKGSAACLGFYGYSVDDLSAGNFHDGGYKTPDDQQHDGQHDRSRQTVIKCQVGIVRPQHGLGGHIGVDQQRDGCR